MVSDPDTLSKAIAAFPQAGRRALVAVVAPQSFAGHLTPRQAELLAQSAELDADTLMMALLPIAAAYARPGLSAYFVGAVARGGSGALYLGANLEFPGTSLWTSVHAEQSAVVQAWSAGEASIESIAVTASPCGLCRQFLMELGDSAALRIVTPARRALLADLLPDAFDAAALARRPGLLSGPRRSLALVHASEDPLVQAAFAAARASYSPYSQTPAGVALRHRSGAVITGAYAESVAHNPGVAPMGAALSQRVFRGLEGDEIVAAALVAIARPEIDHGAVARTLLTAVAPGVRLLSWPARFDDDT